MADPPARPNTRRIDVEEDLWRLIRAAAILDGVSAGEWLSRLARAELRAELAAKQATPQPEADDGPRGA